MRKPPEIRRPCMVPHRPFLDKDGGDDQELAGDGDDARRRGFHDTHFNFLLNWSLAGSAGPITATVNILNCKGRHSELHFLQLLALQL